jgi:hypothetical protein
MRLVPPLIDDGHAIAASSLGCARIVVIGPRVSAIMSMAT